MKQGALRSALDPDTKQAAALTEKSAGAESLLDKFAKPKEGGAKIKFLK